MGTSGVGAFAVDEGAVPEFEDDEGHDLLEVEELAGFHAGEESADGGWVEVAAGFDLGIAERVGDEVFEFRVFEEEFEREEERDFGAMALSARRRSIHLSVRPRSLRCGGMRKASSMSLWSRKGSRYSRLWAMVFLS